MRQRGQATEAETETAAHVFAARSLEPDVLLEHLRVQLGRNAGTVVVDRELDARFGRLAQRNADPAPGGRVAESIVEQILEHAPHQLAIGLDLDRLARQVEIDCLSARPGHRRERLGDAARECARVERRRFELQASRLGLGDVEQVRGHPG
ncbi:MAG TPA: hypothetical protein VMW19_14330 [Myxococcota bacterium]|nr:hypothetical protein [Myxococcota bacterium]